MGFKGLQHFHNRYTCALFPFWFHLPPAVLPLSRNRFVIFIIYGTEQLTALIHVVPMCIQDVQSCYKMYCVWCCRMLWVKMAIEINTNPAKYPRQWFFRWFTATANKYAVLHQVIFIVDRNRIPPPLQHKKEHSFGWPNIFILKPKNLVEKWRRNIGNVTSKVCQSQMEKRSSCWSGLIWAFLKPLITEMLTSRISFKPPPSSLQKTRNSFSRPLSLGRADWSTAGSSKSPPLSLGPSEIGESTTASWCSWWSTSAPSRGTGPAGDRSRR